MRSRRGRTETRQHQVDENAPREKGGLARPDAWDDEQVVEEANEAFYGAQNAKVVELRRR